ncbi:MAG: hypothetical protein GX604_01815 [Actinobacteria bacterium]|nr:hypothetical protein [Actinomycetota bacterium]
MTIRTKATTRGRLTGILLVFFLSLLISPLCVADMAKAEPAQITQAKREANELRALIESTAIELEVAIEAYNGARARLAATEAELEKNTALLQQAEEDLDTASERLTSRVGAIYREGRMSLIEALLSAESLSDFFNRFDLLMRLGRSDADVFEQVTVYRDKVQTTKEKLAQDQMDQQALLEETKATAANVESKLAQREALLADKRQEIEQLEREEAERQARLEEEAREAARLAAERAAASRAPQRPASGGSGSSGGGGSSAPVAQAPRTDLPSSGIGGRVVEVAMQCQGVPYVWAGESLSGFDCSGLVTYVFRQVGIELPHFAAWQFRYGQSVARSDLQPGDVVFFGSSIHHVGIYVGNGNMIHAPYTGASVRINSIDRGDYAGARRMYQ